jgi:hypothetical protein
MYDVAGNPIQHDRFEHVEIGRFFVKDKLDDGIIRISHVNLGLRVKECSIASEKIGMMDICHPS